MQKYKIIYDDYNFRDFDLYYDREDNPIILYIVDNKILFRNIDTDEITKEIKIKKAKYNRIMKVKYYKYNKNEYLMLYIQYDDEIIIIYDIILNKIIFNRTITSHLSGDSISKYFRSRKYFSYVLTTLNGALYLIYSIGMPLNIINVETNQLASKIFLKSTNIKCIKIFKMDLNYLIIGTDSQGAKCYNFKNSKYLLNFTNGYAKDLIIADFDNKKHIILSTFRDIYVRILYKKMC